MSVTIKQSTKQIVIRQDNVTLKLGSISVGGGGGGDGASGWIIIADAVGIGGGSVGSKVYQNPGDDTVLSTFTTSNGEVRFTVRSATPVVTVGGVPATLPPSADTGHYEGTVDVTGIVTGNVVAVATTADGDTGASDTVGATLSSPPTITAAIFTGGYPGSQTELKENDTFQLQVTADKSFDQVTLADVDAAQAAVIGVTPGLSATVTVTIADRGTTPQLLGAQLTVRDSVSGAESASFDTSSAGSVDGVNVVNLNNLQPSVAFGAETYPGAQQALKGVEQATVGATQTNFDTILYDDNGTGHVTVTNPTTAEATKTVTRAGGTYNVEGDGGVANLRVVATRLANDSSAVATAIINIANVGAVITVSEATSRVRSGVAPGNDTTITISADQELLSAPSLDPAVGRGTFQGGGFVGGPKVWTRDLRVPDSENPATGTSHTWINLSATNLANTPTTVITGDDAYVIGGFAPRTINFAPFTANSTETFPLTTEAKLSAGVFSNGNPAVVQPFGTADTTDVGKEGWCAPTAASGTAVQMRMLHSPTVSANSGGLTLTLVEETV